MKRLHGLRAALSLAVLLNQVALPFAHELRTAIAEARFHRADIASTSRGAEVSRPTTPHHHHNPDDCDICLLAALRIDGSAAPRVLPAQDAAATLQISERPLFSKQAVDVSSPRGPPSA